MIGPRIRFAPIALGAALALIACGVEGTGSRATEAGAFEETFEAFGEDDVWAESSRRGRWQVHFEGFGRVGTTRDGATTVLAQRSRAPRSPDETHATLVATRRHFANVDVSASIKTVRQLREPEPNPWEVAWVLWRYSDSDHFYYFMLKRDGWALGKADPRYRGEERFLESGSLPVLRIGRWHRVRVRHIGDDIQVDVDGRKVVSFTDREDPYRRGAVALYAEDADVRFDDVVVGVPSR